MIIEENNTNDVESQEQVDVIETTTNELVNSNKSKEYKIPNYLSDEILNIKAYTYDEINQLSDDMSTDNKIDDSMYDTDLSNVSEKQLVKGTVVALNEKEVIIDIGFKSEGIIDKNEFSSLPEIGEVIDVYLVVFEDRKGRLILSKQKADFHKRWAELRDAYENETVLKGTVIKIIKGGLVVDLGVVNAFLPGSQLDMKPVTNFEQYISNEYEFKIVKFNEFRQNVVISRKATLVPEMDDAKKELLENLDVGSTINGTVKNMTDFGAFIDLGGIDGLLHITDITWGRINHPSDKFTLGEDVTVKVIDYDKEKNRISLGLKQLTKDPWDNAVKSYAINSNVKGKIVNMMNYGAFVELEEGIEGLIHISEISWTKHIKHPSDIYKIGDIVEAIVLSLDAEAKKISLGVKQLEQNPWEEIEKTIKVDEKYKGKITNIVQNGAYVSLENNLEGFLHVNDLSWTRKLKKVDDLISKDESIELIVLDVSSKDKKISLGLKQLVEDPWKNISDYLNENDEIEGKVLHILDKGIIFLLDNDFEGILPISKIDNDIKDNLRLNEKLSLRIEQISIENRKIVLNILENNNLKSSDNDTSEDNQEDLEEKE